MVRGSVAEFGGRVKTALLAIPGKFDAGAEEGYASPGVKAHGKETGMPATPLDRLRSKYKIYPLAERLGITAQCIYAWQQIPSGRALEIEQATLGEITAREILEYNTKRSKQLKRLAAARKKNPDRVRRVRRSGGLA